MSADQDWSEAVKASIENAEVLVHSASNRIRQDAKADFLPTSSQSPGNSPQSSPDDRQTHFPHAQQRTGFCSNSQDQHISQSCAPLPNTSQRSEQAASCEKASNLVPESQQNHCPTTQQMQQKIGSPKRNESNSSSNYPTAKTHPHPQEFSQRSLSQSQGGTLNSSQADRNLSTMIPSFSTRQPQNQSTDHHQSHLSTSHQQRTPLNVSNAPQHPHAARMVLSPRETNVQQVRQGIPHQIQPQQSFIGGRQPHHIQQPQQRFPQKQQQRALNPGPSGTGGVYPGKNMTNPGFTAPAARPHIKVPSTSHPQPAFPGQVQGTRPVGQNQTQASMNMPGQALQPSPPKRNDSILNINRMSQQQLHHQAFSNPHQQGGPQLKQDGECDEGMQHGPGIHQHDFEDEEMYYDEEDEEEMDDIDEEDMEYSGFHGNLGYGYPSSDSDELSEEESALLEELRCCEDDLRYEEIVGQLREKGVDPEEIEEMLYHSNFPQQMYHGENYDENEEEDAEGTVSSSSQGQMPYMRNQLRPHVQTFPAGGLNQTRMYPSPAVGQNQTATSSASASMQGQQVNSVPSGGFNHQGMSNSTSAVSTDSTCHQAKTSSLQGLLFQSQQRVSDSGSSASTLTGVQGDAMHPQQQELKILGHGNQQKKVFQGSTMEASQPTTQTGGWQPLQSIVKAQTQLRLGDSRQPTPKVIPPLGNTQALQVPRPSLINKPPQLQSQGQIGAPRVQGCAQGNLSGVVIRPVQHLTIMNNNQAGLSGQGGQNRPLIVRQMAPVQQLIISSLPTNQQSGLVGTPAKVSPPVVKTNCPRTPLPVNQKPQEQQGMPETLVLASSQQQVSNKPVLPVTQSIQVQQSMIQAPQLKAALEKETAPSEARLARLNVMYMQQNLDKEIMAKKGPLPPLGPLPPHGPLPPQGPPHGPQNPNTQILTLQNRLPSPQNMNQFPVGHLGQAMHPQKQQNQTPPAYQPKHQLPPRQPIPAIVNPNSSTNQTVSGGRPICSVVPFTSQNRGQIPPTNIPRQSTPQQSASFVRPRNPSPLSPQQIGSTPQQIDSTPQQIGSSPHQIGNTPQQIGSSPQQIVSTPQQIGNTSHQIGTTPHQIGNTPHQIGNTPQQIGSSPHQIGSISQQIGSSPHQIGSTSQHFTGMLPNKMSMPAITHSTSSSSASPTTAASRCLTQGNTVPLTSNQTVAQHPVSDHAQQQQPQNPSVKSETFSLDHLSEDKCIITGKGKQQGLTVNMVYQLRSPKDNSLVLALWNGERFEDLKHADMKALAPPGQGTHSGPQQPSDKSGSYIQKAQVTQQGGQAMMSSEKDRKVAGSSAVPGGSSKFQVEFMQSLSHKSDEEQSDCAPESYPYPALNTSHELGQSLDRLQKTVEDVSLNQSTYIKPLPEGLPQQETEEEEEDDYLFKKPFSENEDYFRVCQYCGYTSKNFKRCEGCKRVFHGEVKIHSLKKQPTKNITSSSGLMGSTSIPLGSAPETDSRRKNEVDVQEFNNVPLTENTSGRGRGRGSRGRSGRTKGGGLRGRNGVKETTGETFDGSDSDNSSVDRKRNNDGSGSSSDGSGKKRQVRAKSKNPVPRKRKKADEPVTLTISSDEDEPSSTSNNMASHAPSPVHSAGSESPIFPSTPAQPVNAFGRFRRVLMEDEDGQSKLSKKIQQQVITPQMDRLEEDEEEDEDEDDEGDEPPTYEIDIRSVRVGSMRTQPEGPLLINLQGVCFKVRSERTEEAFEFEILAQDVEQVKFFSGQTQPVLFLFLSPECGEILRNICHMEHGDDEYFDPSSTDMKQKMVVIIIECFNYMPHEMLRETLSLWADLNHVEDDCFIEELTEESANDLLIQSAPPVLTADVERDVVKFKRRYLRDSNNMHSVPRLPGSPSDSTDNEPDSTSSSPPEIKHYFGSSIRLLQYPPAPARGIPITTEDLLCLTEGEFLNDVIIDFYLQYLYQEKLTEENRRRTHIFSSFFYKRLTQRDRHSEKTEEDAKKSLPERRHARVKKWTKTVDLFSKDFIIVPINEHSHWYLAVICFPGLANSEVVPFIPSIVHKGDVDEESSDNTVREERPIEDNVSQDSMPKTILGQQLNAKQCLDNEDSKYNLGQKQSCILMFDSLAGPSRTPNVRMLREYLQCEWNAKKSEPRNIAKILRGSTPKVPQQSNYSDCGVFLLQYVESFFEDPIADFQIPMKGLQSWFPEELVHNKRREIHDLIMSLHRRYQEERGDPRILDIKFESTPRESPMKFHQNPEMNSRPEEGMCSGFNRDDESSNSSFSGEMNRAEQLPSATSLAMEQHSSPLQAQGHLDNQYCPRRQNNDDEHDGNEDQDANNSESIDKHRVSHVLHHQ